MRKYRGHKVCDMLSYADIKWMKKALGFLSACAYDRMMTNACGQRETKKKQII